MLNEYNHNKYIIEARFRISAYYMKYRIKKYGQKGRAKTTNKLIAFGTTKISPYYMK